MREVMDGGILDAAAPNATQDRVGVVVRRIADQHDVKAEISPTDSLVDRGMTSMAMVDLMLAIEAEFDKTIPQRELTPGNFQSVASLAALVARL